MVFIPFYLIIFGIILILAEFQLPFFIKYILFLANYLGRYPHPSNLPRGIYNLFLSTIVINDITTSFSSLQGNSTTAEVITYIVVAILALIGVFYILLFVFRVDDKPNPKGLDYQHLTGAQIIKLKKRSFTQYKAWVKEELNKLEKPSQHSEDQITLQTQA